ncbi:MAG: hypothetical protein AAFV29_22455, partial [Myxococcota bacterium]
MVTSVDDRNVRQVPVEQPPPPPEVKAQKREVDTVEPSKQSGSQAPNSADLADKSSLDSAEMKPVVATTDTKAESPADDTGFIVGVQDALRDVAKDETRFRAFVEQTFGLVEEDSLGALRDDILNERWDNILPNTEMVEFDAYGVNGAYSAETSTIYLEAGNLEDVRWTYLEELGHHFQHRLVGDADAALHDDLGDEGRIFALQFAQDEEGLVTGIDES